MAQAAQQKNQTGHAKPVPVRRCAACGSRDAKGALLRFVRSPRAVPSEANALEAGAAGDYTVNLDLRGKANGRGAYLHISAPCLDAGLRKGRLEHALQVHLSPENRAKLIADLRAAGSKEQGGTRGTPGPAHS